MIGLFDSDVLIKLCCCNLWWEAIDALGISHPYRLAPTSSARWVKGKLDRKLGKGDHAEIMSRIEGVAREVPVIADELTEGLESDEGFKVLREIADIDDGENILAAVLMRSPGGKLLLSGDKRFIKAFRDALPGEWDKLSSYIISFEMCLEAIEAKYGFDHIVANAMAVKHCDGTLSIAIQPEPNREHFVDCISSFNPCRAVVTVVETVVVVE
ncbi:hypothetical protein CYG48_13215 [Neorhizobium sp. SOG26]|uniref:hypothetical protein n=1 Tax=Neorhizobium sp. SOG26 TaxID=2060726 RepID=UPI000E5872F5|nr:hypothetical protein [Neorhizobium sp. SOG26]AXV16564.1 hypothetical protein CYG48_13215 [Neorhizobium sp. SOG26]